MDAMKIHLIEGRDFRASDMSPGVAIVNETFAKQYFGGENPIGKYFEKMYRHLRYQVVGLMADVPYRSIDASGRMQPTREATFIVRTFSENPLALASTLLREVPAARPEFRVSNIRTQPELIRAQTVRERLLAMLALFFAGVALLLAGIGLYGVLDYSVLQRWREIGIRIAIGAQSGHIVRRATGDVFSMVIAGALAGLVLGMVSARYIETLFYGMKATDPAMLALPWLTILAAALLAALSAVFRAVHIDPATMLRAD
jgi:ABC-type lipoprotein release transport system permease subunit